MGKNLKNYFGHLLNPKAISSFVIFFRLLSKACVFACFVAHIIFSLV